MAQTAISLPESFLYLSKVESHDKTSVISDKQEGRVLPLFIARASQLIYKDKAHFSFNVSEQFGPHFILIKGLIDFHRPKEVQFVFNRFEKTFEVSTSVQYTDFLFSFLDMVQTWVNKEVQFKTSLKKVIQFEDQYRAQRSALYGSLFGI